MTKVAIISGWLGKSFLSEYYRSDDGRSDFIVELVSDLKREYDVIYSREELFEHRHSIDIEIHLNAQTPLLAHSKKICIVLEHQSIRPQNYLTRFIKYDHILSWSNFKSYFKNNNYSRFNFPHDFEKKFTGDEVRHLPYVLICSNRNTVLPVDNNFYYVRQNIIRECEEKYSDRFSLFGHGWHRKFQKHGFVARFRTEVFKKLNIGSQTLNVYRGTIQQKEEVLRKAKFNFAIENIGGLDGYISEKLFDSFMFGSVPIFLPSWDIPETIIPKNLYIDFRCFASLVELFEYCDALPESFFEDWSQNVTDFMANEATNFSSLQFIRKVREAIRCSL
jgi:alpha(1,3/1,4) fucosyltransferase